MPFYSSAVTKIIQNWPGKFLGEYRFLPLFFVCGAAIEYSMIHWSPNGINFYTIYKKKKIEEIIQARQKEVDSASIQ